MPADLWDDLLRNNKMSSRRYPATIYLKAPELEKLVFIVHYAMQSGLQVEARLGDNKEWEIQLSE